MQLDLRLAIWNANGLPNHTREIEVFLSTNYIDVLLVSETHFNSRTHFYIKDYDLIHTNHPDNRAHAGSCILVKSTIKYEIHDNVQENYIQATCIKIKSRNGDIVVSSIYCPPRHNITCQQYTDFFKNIGTRFLVGGDFNAKHPWWGSRLINPKGRELHKCITKENLSVLSTGSPTYWPSDPCKLPDLLDFAVYAGISKHRLDICSSDDLSSDHTPILINLCESFNNVSKNYQLLTPATDVKLFQQCLDTNLNLNLSLKSGEDLDDAVEDFTNLLHEAAHLSTPTIENKSGDSLQTSAEIRQFIIEKRRLRRNWQRSRNPYDKTLFNKACKDLKAMLSDHRENTTATFFEKINNPKYDEHLLWKSTKYIKRPVKRNPMIKNADGSWCKSDKSTADSFALHLKNIFQPFDFNTNEEKDETLDFLDSPCQMDLPLKHFSPNEVQKEIRTLSKGKSPGYDNINVNVAKNLTYKSVIFLTLIFNCILRLDRFPSQWKCAEVIMIPKPNKPENLLTSFRPISLLPIFSKLFEKLFLRRLLPVLEKNNIIPDHQFGFRQKHGTPEQCHRIINEITDALENKRYCSAVFLDIQQAFDRVWHHGLLFKIKKVLPAQFYLFFKSYLSQRYYYVKVRDERSSLFDIKAGIPQGSVLGPILYTLYTADMPINNNVMVATYADDTAVVGTSQCPNEASLFVQSQLYLLEKWFKRWNIKVNSEKSSHITFALRRGDCSSVSINGEPIPKKNAVNYLGMTLDRRLTWKSHIKAKQKQLKIKTRKLYWLLGPKSKLNLNNKLRIYKVILKPVWTYGIQLWGTSRYSNVDILERFQSKTLRLITNAPWFVRNSTISRDLCIPSINEEIQRFSEKYVQRLSNHPNVLAVSLLDNSNETRRLKRKHVLDLAINN